MRALEIHIDGASRGNPGPAGIGVIITQDGQLVKNMSVFLGIQTNNVAEYMSLIFALQEALILGANKVKIYSDSQLLCRQVKNEYKIKSPNLIGLYSQVKQLLRAFDSVEINHIYRDNNRGADKLANKAIKAKQLVT